MVEVELRHDIAEGSDIKLVGVEGRLDRRGKVARFGEKLLAIGSTQVVNLAYTLAARDEDKPGIVAIVHQQQATEWEIADLKAVGGQARVEGKGGGH
jgi:hypothetical protein